MINVIHIVLFTFLAVIAVAIIRLRDLFAAVMLMGIFSLLSASLFTVMDAVDVAFTEAAVGAGISTVLMLTALALSTNKERRPDRVPILPLMVVMLTGSALVYGTLDMPLLGDPGAPAHVHVAPEYLEISETELHIPNVVTTVLATFRGYDTLGETTVVFTAGLGVLMILSGAKRVMSWQERQRERWRSDPVIDPDVPLGSPEERGELG